MEVVKEVPKKESPKVYKEPIDPADESWGNSEPSDDVKPPSPAKKDSEEFKPILDDFEPNTKNLKERKKDEARDLSFPQKKEPVKEEAPAYVPKKVPIIDPVLWKKLPPQT